MGNDNSSRIKIDVDRNNSLYYSGETVSGTVTLHTTEENLETCEIYISLTGEIACGTIPAAPAGEGVLLSRGGYQKIQFYCKEVRLPRPNMSQQDFINNQGGYAWPFQIPLIINLPPSINAPDAIPRVRYYLQVVIDKPWYESNVRRKKFLTIYPRVNLSETPQCLLPSIFECENRKDIILVASFNKLGYVVGENIQFTLKIQNPQKVLILHTNLSILKCYRIEEKLNKCIVYKTMLPKIQNLTNEQIMETFSIKIPFTQFPPSYKYQEENLKAFVHIFYMLKLTVKVEGILANCQIDIPITLGTEPNPFLNRQQTFNPLNVFYLPNYQQSTSNDDDDDDLPPDYDSVMQNLQ